MAKSYFYLILDTTGPLIDIYAPIYTTLNATIQVFVQTNEPLGQWQNVYLIDAHGTKHDLIFDLNLDSLYGEITFDDIPLGIARLYIQLVDTVGNLSDLVYVAINIVKGIAIRITTDIQTRPINSNWITRAIVTDEQGRSVDITKDIRPIETDHKTRQVKV